MKNKCFKFILVFLFSLGIAVLSLPANAYYYYNGYYHGGYYSHYHRYYGPGYYYNCKWIKGHWYRGHWYEAKKVCWTR